MAEDESRRKSSQHSKTSAFDYMLQGLTFANVVELKRDVTGVRSPVS